MADIHLVVRWARMAAHTGQLDAIGSGGVDLGFADVGGDVRREVGRRVMHLVEQLLLERRLGHQSTRPGGLADGATAIGPDRRNGKSDVVEPGYFLEARVGE